LSRLSSATPKWGTVITRVLSDFGALNRIPTLVCSKLSITLATRAGPLGRSSHGAGHQAEGEGWCEARREAAESCRIKEGEHDNDKAYASGH